MSDRSERIAAALQRALSPESVTVTDDSAKHAGHAGAREGGQTHYSVIVVSSAFVGLGRVARHRLVTQALADEFADGLHALSLTLRAPSETR